jgi:DNA polymerase
MKNRNDSDLKIAVAQSLENLSRAGLQWLVRGESERIIQWMSEYGGDIQVQPAATDRVSPMPSGAQPDVMDISEGAEAVQVRPLFTTTTEAVSEKLGSWNSAFLPVEQRQAILDAQSHIVSACSKCSQLVCSRTRTVYGVGNCKAEIVFIGEGPGFEEDRQGIPFVGPAGQLLDKIIIAMNLERPNVYIMNAVKCRPQNNRTPTDEEIANCQPYFQQQLDVIQPKFIVCLGAVAARALLKTSLGIGKLRGKFYSYCGAQVAVTYHPAYLLRNPDAKKLTWEDMKKVMAAM